VDENGTKKGAILSSTLSPPGGSSSSSCETSFGKSIAPAITATKLEQISLAEKEEDEDEETENRMMCYSEEEEEEEEDGMTGSTSDEEDLEANLPPLSAETDPLVVLKRISFGWQFALVDFALFKREELCVLFGRFSIIMCIMTLVALYYLYHYYSDDDDDDDDDDDVSWKSAIAVATLTFNDSTLVVLLLVFVVALFSSSPPPSILAILEHALRTFVRKPEPSFPTTKTVG